MTVLATAGALLFVIYICLFIFTGNIDSDRPNESASESTTNEENSGNDGGSSEGDQSTGDLEVNPNEEEADDKLSDENESSEDESSEGDESRKVEEGSEENVDRVITQDWKPVGTEQNISGEHRTTFQQGSQDWQEILKAASKATGVSTENMIDWRVENAGSGQVNATITNQSQDQVYRVLIEWVDGEGYRPIQVKELNSNPYN